jgi:putative transcriptional regulator
MHPSEETLLTVASGYADQPLRLLIEGHLDRCASCRSTVGELSLGGGALLASLEDEPVPDRLWQSLQDRLAPASSGAAGSPLVTPYDGLPLPESVRQELPGRPVRWRSALARGSRFSVLTRDAFTGSYLILAHMPPSRVAPRHRHVGTEDVLVLTGGYEDERGSYEAGAFASYEPGSEHAPLTEPDEECWTLVRLEKPNHFLGWRGILQSLLP